MLMMKILALAFFNPQLIFFFDHIQNHTQKVKQNCFNILNFCVLPWQISCNQYFWNLKYFKLFIPPWGQLLHFKRVIISFFSSWVNFVDAMSSLKTHGFHLKRHHKIGSTHWHCSVFRRNLEKWKIWNRSLNKLSIEKVIKVTSFIWSIIYSVTLCYVTMINNIICELNLNTLNFYIEILFF